MDSVTQYETSSLSRVLVNIESKSVSDVTNSDRSLYFISYVNCEVVCLALCERITLDFHCSAAIAAVSIFFVCFGVVRCQAKFLTCEISDHAICARTQ